MVDKSAHVFKVLRDYFMRYFILLLLSCYVWADPTIHLLEVFSAEGTPNVFALIGQADNPNDTPSPNTGVGGLYFGDPNSNVGLSRLDLKVEDQSTEDNLHTIRYTMFLETIADQVSIMKTIRFPGEYAIGDIKIVYGQHKRIFTIDHPIRANINAKLQSGALNLDNDFVHKSISHVFWDKKAMEAYIVAISSPSPSRSEHLSIQRGPMGRVSYAEIENVQFNFPGEDISILSLDFGPDKPVSLATSTTTNPHWFMQIQLKTGEIIELPPIEKNPQTKPRLVVNGVDRDVMSLTLANKKGISEFQIEFDTKHPRLCRMMFKQQR
jgi:hypothetical protein